MTRNITRSAARTASLSSRKSPPVTVHLRKMYVDCRFGQLHVHTAFPSSGGFDELTPLVCIHPAPLSGPGHDRFAFNNWASEAFFDNLRVEALTAPAE